MKKSLLSANLKYLIDYGKKQFSQNRGLHLNSNEWKAYITIGPTKFYTFLLNGDLKFRTHSSNSGKTYNQIIKISAYKKFESALLVLFLVEASENEIIDFLMKCFMSSTCRIECNCEAACLEENTLIDLVDGKTKTIKEMYDDYNNGITNYVYSIDENNNPTINKVNKVWKSGTVNKLVKITLDNDKYILTTPEHYYIMRDGSSKQAIELDINDSLMPIYFTYDKKGYKYANMNNIIDCNKRSVHRIVAKKYYGEANNNMIVHHIDFNKKNNNPENLIYMDKHEHIKYHANHIEENREKIINNLLSYNHKIKDIEIIELNHNIDVYDIEVENNHNFYVNAGIVLHNSYWGVNYNLTKIDSFYGGAELRPPKIRDPQMKNLLCKHLWVILDAIEQDLPKFIKELFPYYKRYFGINSPTGIKRTQKEIGEKGLRKLVANAKIQLIKLKAPDLVKFYDSLVNSKLQKLYNDFINNEKEQINRPSEISEENKKEISDEINEMNKDVNEKEIEDKNKEMNNDEEMNNEEKMNNEESTDNGTTQ